MKIFSPFFMVNDSSSIRNRRRILILRTDVYDTHKDDTHNLKFTAQFWTGEHGATPVSCSACRVTLQIKMWHRVEQISLTAEARTRPHEGGTYCSSRIVTLRDILTLANKKRVDYSALIMSDVIFFNEKLRTCIQASMKTSHYIKLTSEAQWLLYVPHGLTFNNYYMPTELEPFDLCDGTAVCFYVGQVLNFSI